jgi:hypothetical protein
MRRSWQFVFQSCSNWRRYLPSLQIPAKSCEMKHKDTNRAARICAGQGDNKSGAARALIDLSCNRIAAWDLHARKSLPMSDDGADADEANRNQKDPLREPIVGPMPRITFLPGELET